MNIEVKLVDEYPKELFDKLVERNLKSEGVFISPHDLRTIADESFQIQSQKINIAAYDGDKLVGLSTGEAIRKNRFAMHISLVEKEYRGQGIYQKMLELMLDKTKHYDEIESNHHLFNNKIIALKLKYNFHIIGIEQSILVGPRLTMRYYNNKKLYNLMKYRVGQIQKPF